jgi:D-methionine transport system substrate-binding protein
MSEQPPVLPEKPKSNRLPILIAAGAIVAVGVAAAIVVPPLLSGDDEAAPAAGGEELRTIEVGTTDASEPQWEVLAELAAEEGIDLELVNFSEYPLPNPALASGETDLNQFQHLDYLSNHIIATGDDLVPIGSTVIVPLPIYSNEWDSIDDIPEGGEIAVPNDPSNLGRALGVLEAAGLVTLTSEPGEIPGIDAIDAANSSVTVTPVDASQTAAALQSVDAAIVNNNFALDAGLDPADALFSVDPEDAASAPYINVWVARGEDATDEDFLTLARLWHDPAVVAAVQEASGGTAVIVDLTPAELQERLDQIIADKEAAAAAE